MAVGFDEPGPPASQEAIEGVERALDVQLPAEYSEFLERHNGGEPEPYFYDPMVGVRLWLSAGPTEVKGVRGLESVTRKLWGRDDVDPALLPIGEDDTGNFVCLKVRGEGLGGVYYWDHETPDTGGARVTDSFAEFFAGLRPEEELDPMVVMASSEEAPRQSAIAPAACPASRDSASSPRP